MPRLTRPQFASLKLLAIGLIAADLFAIWVWALAAANLFRLAWVHWPPFGVPAWPSCRLGCLGRRSSHPLWAPCVIRPGRTEFRGRSPIQPSRS